MFVSYFPNATVHQWFTTSTVALAVGPSLTGPFTFVRDVVPPRVNSSYFDRWDVGNPKTYRIGSELVLLYTSNGYNQMAKGKPGPWYIGGASCDLQGNGGASRCAFAEAWERPALPLLNVTQPWEHNAVTNPSLLVYPNNSVALFFRGGTGEPFGVATAPSWRGPYTLVPGYPIWGGADMEDQEIFWNPLSSGRPGCQALLHGHSAQAGRHAFTTDPECLTGWTKYKQDVAYSTSVRWAGGGGTQLGRRERPQIILDSAGEPTHLVNAAQGSGGGYSFTMVDPIATTAA